MIKTFIRHLMIFIQTHTRVNDCHFKSVARDNELELIQLELEVIKPAIAGFITSKERHFL